MSAQTFTNGTSSDTCKAIRSNHAGNVLESTKEIPPLIVRQNVFDGL